MHDYIVTLFVIMAVLYSGSASAEQTREASADSLKRMRLIFIEQHDALGSDRSINSTYLNLGMGYEIISQLEVFGFVSMASNSGYSEDHYNPALGRMDADTIGIGVSGMVRWNLIEGAIWGGFVDASMGTIYFDQNFPPGGTRWNFYSRSGAGISYKINATVSMEISYHRMHISNGQGVGEDNPAIDSEALAIGLKMIL